MQTATKRGSPPRARRGASPHFLGEARRAPRRGRPGALAYGGGQGPPLLPRGLPGRCGAGEKDRCGAGGKGQVRTGQKGRQVRTGEKRPAGAHGAKSRQVPHGGKGCAVRRWGKGQVRHGFRPALCLPGDSAEGACRAGAVPLAAAGEGGEKGKGGISLFPRPWRPRPMCRGRGRRRCGGAPGCAAGAKQALRGFPEEGCPEGASGRKKKGGAPGAEIRPRRSPLFSLRPLWGGGARFLELFAAPFRHREYREGAD